jgi:hypothetical protein
MKKEELIGKKVRGFRFERNKNFGLQYMPNIMDNYIDKVGEIVDYNIKFDSYRVKFEDGMSYHYPAEFIEQHLIVEENEKTKVVCTNTICQGECGECNYMEIVGKEEPKPTFTPIAMKCNEDQFDDIRPLLESGGCKINDISNFIQYYYLTNNFNGVQNDISNVDDSMIEDFNRKVYHEWDEKIFLNACGIESKEEPEKKIEQGYICPQTKQQCDDECCVSAENCHLKTSMELEKPEKNNPLDDLPIIGEGFLMEVSNDKRFWSKAKVICKYKEYYIAIVDNSVTVSVWKYIQSIPKTKITRAEFEQKFEIID